MVDGPFDVVLQYISLSRVSGVSKGTKKEETYEPGIVQVEFVVEWIGSSDYFWSRQRNVMRTDW